jgi:L-asparaginase/Glu-tRNA(Gln) amidotransferase subunit D
LISRKAKYIFDQKSIDEKIEKHKKMPKKKSIKISAKSWIVKNPSKHGSKLFQFFADNYVAFVIEGTGLGHAPTNLGTDNLKNYEILKKYIEKGGIVAITSQCITDESIHQYIQISEDYPISAASSAKTCFQKPHT